MSNGIEAPYQQHSGTSMAAAAKMQGEAAATLRAMVLAFLKQRGAHGATDEECQLALGIIDNTQRPRRIELVQDFEAVFKSGMERPTTSGRNATVWVVREFASAEEIAAQCAANVAHRKKVTEQKEAQKAQRKAAQAAKALAKQQAAATVAAIAAAPAAPAVAPPPVASTPAVAPRPPVHDPFDLGPPVPKVARPITSKMFSDLKQTLATAPSPAAPSRPVVDPFVL